MRGANLSSALCAKANRNLGTAGRRSGSTGVTTARPEARGGDYAWGHVKGQCADDAYAAGVAWTNRLGSPWKEPMRSSVAR